MTRAAGQGPELRRRRRRVRVGTLHAQRRDHDDEHPDVATWRPRYGEDPLRPWKENAPPQLAAARRHGHADLVADTRLAPIIENLVRKVTGPSPPPRGQPYLGLESASGTGTQLLDALAAHGIFRKYELVLDVAGGLGATG